MSKIIASIPRYSLLVVIFLLTVGYFLSERHASYYMGTEADSVGCGSCHLDANGGDILDRIIKPRYVSPINFAASPDGSQLYVTAQDADALLVVDLERRELLDRIEVGRQPREVLLSRDGSIAYVSNEWSDSISVIDLKSRSVTGRIATPNMPTGMALSPDERTLYVANWQDDSISAIDLATGEEAIRLAGGGSPNLIAASADHSKLLVTNELSYLTSTREVPISEVTLIDTATQQIEKRLRFENAHLLEGVTFVPPGDLAVVALVRPKNLLPVLHVNRGWAMNNGIGVIDVESGEVVQLILDDLSASYADPYDVAVTPDGKRLFVSHSGVDQITVIDVEKLREVVEEARSRDTRLYAHRLDLSERFVIKRIATGPSPKGLTVSPDGKLLFVAERLNDSILVVDTEQLEPAYTISLNGPTRETEVRRGERLFNSAARTFQGQFSCRSCHPRNHVDRLQYDFEPDGLGQNILDNRTLLGVGGTAPFKWNGKNTSLFMQCGIRFASILTRVHPFNSAELSSLVAFIRSLPSPPNPNISADGKLTESQERGKHFFERSVTKSGEEIAEIDRCITCHPPPLFTNRKRFDVGSASPTDTIREFDTPHLKNIYNSAPYLHDGKAETLHEIWTVFNAEDTHGITKDMSNRDLNDLIEYLKTL